MGNILTAAQIKEHFKSEWVLVEDPQTNDTLEVQSGRVRWQSKDRDDCLSQGHRAAPQRFAMLYTGEMPEDTAIVL